MCRCCSATATGRSRRCGPSRPTAVRRSWCSGTSIATAGRIWRSRTAGRAPSRYCSATATGTSRRRGRSPPAPECRRLPWRTSMGTARPDLAAANNGANSIARVARQWRRHVPGGAALRGEQPHHCRRGRLQSGRQGRSGRGVVSPATSAGFYVSVLARQRRRDVPDAADFYCRLREPGPRRGRLQRRWGAGPDGDQHVFHHRLGAAQRRRLGRSRQRRTTEWAETPSPSSSPTSIRTASSIRPSPMPDPTPCRSCPATATERFRPR